MAVTDVFPDLVHVDLGRVVTAVGARAYARGKEYARGRVLKLDWDRDCELLQARVVGRGEIYGTDVYFEPDASGGFEFLEGECTCPVGHNCKHVAAAVLAASQGPPSVARRRPATTRAAAQTRRQPSWEQSLQALLGSAQPVEPSSMPFGIELTLGMASAPRPGAASTMVLSARLMREGKRGWVNGNLSWSGLDSWQVENEGYDPEQLLFLREIYALYQATVVSRRSYYSSDADRTIDLARLDAVLWTLLEAAAERGVRLRYGEAGWGEIAPADQAELRVDVSRADDGGLSLAPSLVAGEAEDVVPVGFLGSHGHGVVYADRAALAIAGSPELCRWRLARLASPVPPALRQLALAGTPIEVPAGAAEVFSTKIWPRLRHVAPVVSADGSFAPPEISAPSLALRATYGARHALDIVWEWAYTIDGSPVRVRLDGDPATTGYRDPGAEQALIDSLDVDLGRYGMMGPAGLRPQARLGGLDTMRFTTEVLPLLRGTPGVLVETSGEPADFREVGDSLVIGVSTDDVAGSTDWFDLGVSITVEGRALPFADVFSALAAGLPDLLLDDGAYFSLEKPQLQALRRLIDEARALQDAPPDELRISRYQVGLWDELRQLGVVDRQASAWERQVTALLELDTIEAAEVPPALTAELRPYQRDGFGWLSFLWQHQLGGILADDMGLGKTLQTLALISHARRGDLDLAPFLIVAPTSVVPNWVAEAARFTPDLTVSQLDSTLARCGRSIEDVVGASHVVVTSYALFRLDFDAYDTVAWSGLVLDEAQQVKNRSARAHACARRLATPFKLAITGTPMENNLMELWSLLSITAPGLFPNPARFAEHYAKPIERRGDADLLAQFRRRIKPLVKRRTKELVAADLPPKLEQLLDVDLHPAHRKVYETHLQRERQKVLGLLEDFDRNRFTILRSLTLLRQLSLHPTLVGSPSQQRGKGGGRRPARASGKSAHKIPCAKLDVLVEQLGEVIDGGHRALVFSQFTGFLGIVRARLDQEGIEYCYLDGRTRQRDNVLRSFKHGSAPVFLISLKAGGVGLNLTEADYCFLLDPWWNPATEAQAVDRTHRIGQARNVIVYRLIARDTIEEKVMALKQRKAELFAGVMDDGNLFAGGLDAQDVRALFS